MLFTEVSRHYGQHVTLAEDFTGLQCLNVIDPAELCKHAASKNPLLDADLDALARGELGGDYKEVCRREIERREKDDDLLGKSLDETVVYSAVRQAAKRKGIKIAEVRKMVKGLKAL